MSNKDTYDREPVVIAEVTQPRCALRFGVGASTTTISVRCLAAQLTETYGNTGTTRYVVIGDEIISYTGHTEANTSGS